MRSLLSLILLTSTLVAGQRPSFAGTRPIGFPDTPNRTTTASLDNRFGDGTQLPLEANGDRDLIDRLSKLPVNQQPFWFINWQHLVEQRKNPQTFPQKPNVFVDPIPTNTGTNNRFSNNESSNTGNSNSASQFNSGALNSGSNRPNTALLQAIFSNSTQNTQTTNRFSEIPNSNSNFNSGNANSGFANTNNAFGSSGNRNDAQQSALTQSPVIKAPDYYPQQTVQRRPGYGR